MMYPNTCVQFVHCLPLFSVMFVGWLFFYLFFVGKENVNVSEQKDKNSLTEEHNAVM